MGNSCKPGERKPVARSRRERSLIGLASAFTIAEIFPQVAKVEQGGDIDGVPSKGCLEFARGLFGLLQMIGIDDRSIKVHFLRIGDIELEGLPIRSERIIELPRLALEPGKIIPAVGKVRL